MRKKNNTKTIINHQIMNTVFGNNPVSIHDYLNEFVTKGRETLAHIRAAIKIKDIENIQHHFHKLSGPAGSSGFMQIFNLCKMGEEKANYLSESALEEICIKIEKFLQKIADSNDIVYTIRH